MHKNFTETKLYPRRRFNDSAGYSSQLSVTSAKTLRIAGLILLVLISL